MTTPTAREDSTRLDHLPWPEAVRRAWTDPELYPDRYAHQAMRITIHDCAPELARALDRAAAEQPARFVCPKCGRASSHPEDLRQGYCGACHDWTDPSAPESPLRGRLAL